MASKERVTGAEIQKNKELLPDKVKQLTKSVKTYQKTVTRGVAKKNNGKIPKAVNQLFKTFKVTAKGRNFQGRSTSWAVIALFLNSLYDIDYDELKEDLPMLNDNLQVVGA